MSYQGPIKVNNTKEEISSLEILNPKKNVKEESGSDYKKEEIIIENARKKTLKTLNAIKIVAPIISALMERPGVDAEGEDLSEGFRSLIKETSSLSEQICQSLNLDPNNEKNFWVRNVLERLFADFYKQQWSVSGKLDSVFLKDCINKIISDDVLLEKIATENNIEKVMPESIVKLALIKSVVPILKEVNNFDLYRTNFESDLDEIMDKLYNSTVKALDKIADDFSGPTDKADLFNLILQEASNVYALSWKAEAKRIKEISANFSSEQLRKHLSKYPDGLPLEKVDYNFDKYFNKMILISERLVPSKKGNIEKRLKA